MEWPSKNVCPGGIMHPPKVQYSPETKQFLKLLMDETKLSIMQRKKMNYYLRNGEPLPTNNQINASMNNTKKLIKNNITIRPVSSKRRNFDTILQSGVYEREKFIPKHPRINRDEDKLRLQNKMAYGKDIEPKFKTKVRKIVEDNNINRFDQLVKEIDEREKWLKEMEDLGAADKHKLVIEQQIQARVREMEQLKLSNN